MTLGSNYHYASGAATGSRYTFFARYTVWAVVPGGGSSSTGSGEYKYRVYWSPCGSAAYTTCALITNLEDGTELRDTRAGAYSLAGSTPYVKDDISLNIWYSSGYHFAVTSSYTTSATLSFDCNNLFSGTDFNLTASQAYQIDGPYANSSYCAVIDIR